jgi:hypothetical protein
LPLDVVAVVGAGAGAGRVGVRTTAPPDDLRGGAETLGVLLGTVVVGAVVGAVAAGTSFNAGCAAVSAFAICRSRLRLVSWASVSSFFFSVHALRATAIAIASGAAHRVIVIDICIASLFMWHCRSP